MKNNAQSLRWVIGLQWRTSKFIFGWSLFHSLYTGLRPIAQTYAVAKLISEIGNAISDSQNTERVYFWLATLLLVEIVDQIVSNVNRLLRNKFEHTINLAANEIFFEKMYQLSQEQFDNEAFNTKMERAREGLFEIWRVLDEISWAFSALIGFAGTMIAVMAQSPFIGVLIILTTIPVMILQIKENSIREKIYKQTEPYDRVAFRSRWLLIDPEFMPELRLMNGVKKLVKAWRTNSQKSHELSYRSDKKLALISASMQTLQPLLSFGAIVYFFQRLMSGAFGLDTFLFLRGIIEQAGGSALQFASGVQRLHNLTINLKNFNEIQATAPAIPDGKVKLTRPLTIEFRHVSFIYPGKSEKVLDDVSFIINPGTKLALVGENGAGKTTLIKLLLRQYLPTSGQILINSVDIRELKREDYYDALSNLSQRFLIVQHLSLRDNLTIGLNKEPSDEEIYEATELAGAKLFIEKFPKKLDTLLDTSFDDGVNLSGGQYQRIGVARAILRNGDILILDEPTSAIDAKAEYQIFNNIYKSHSGKTTLIVSHRFSTVRKADSIIVLENGKITEYGTHDELLKYGGTYKEMFEAQAEGYR